MTYKPKILEVAAGGTGDATLTNHGVLVGQGTSAVAVTAAGTALQVLQSGGASADPVYSTATYPATNTTGDLIYSSGTNTYSNLPISTIPGSNLEYNGTNASWFDPRQETIFFDDFISPNAQSMHNWSATTSNAGAVAGQTGQNSGHPGVIQLSTGTNTNGGAATTTGSTIILGGGAITVIWVINISAASDGTDTFSVLCGMSDAAGASLNPNNGVYFKYTSTGTTPNWNIVCRGGSSEVSQDSGIAISTGTFTTLRIDINAAATSVAFSINGVTANNSPLSSHIPTLVIGLYNSILKSAGNTARTNQYDMVYMYQKLTSAR
ncbi:MAG: hypothetical protein V4563_17025 [Pseudomonadota bacterium]